MIRRDKRWNFHNRLIKINFNFFFLKYIFLQRQRASKRVSEVRRQVWLALYINRVLLWKWILKGVLLKPLCWAHTWRKRPCWRILNLIEHQQSSAWLKVDRGILVKGHGLLDLYQSAKLWTLVLNDELSICWLDENGMKPTHTYLWDSDVSVIPPAKSEHWILGVQVNDKVLLGTRVCKWLKHHEVIFRSVVVDQRVACVKCKRKWLLAQLAFIILPVIAHGRLRDLCYFLWVHPLFKATQVDVLHGSRAITGIDKCFISVWFKTDPTYVLIKIYLR